jgi:hypothetical protein
MDAKDQIYEGRPHLVQKNYAMDSRDQVYVGRPHWLDHMLLLSYYKVRIHSHDTFWMNGADAQPTTRATTGVRLLRLGSKLGHPHRCRG